MVEIILVAVFSFLAGYLYGREKASDTYEHAFREYEERVKDIYK